MGGGARAYRDGEPAMAPFFAAMADTGEQEIIEEDVPFLQLNSKKIKKDNQAFGKFHGGMGYEMAVAAKGTPLWGFATVPSGSKFPAVPGLFGGYGCPTLPLAKIKGVNVFDYLRDDPGKWSFDFETLMNTRPFPEARYSTHHMAMGFELADEGEIYMICTCSSTASASSGSSRPPRRLSTPGGWPERGVPVNALVRAYRLGQDTLLQRSLGEVRQQGGART